MNGNAPDQALERFLTAQARDYDQALDELRQGRKQSHWMWYVFPQIAGLGRSSTAQFYAITDIDEAKAYLAHPVLGERLNACIAAILPWASRRSAERILGLIDAMKLRSSLTLFEQAAIASGRSPDPFAKSIKLFYGGERDERTLTLLSR